MSFVQVLIDIVRAIDAQQKLGMFHGDIKIDNVLIHHDKSKDVYSGKMIDLGQSQRIDGDNFYIGVCFNAFLQRPTHSLSQFDDKRRDSPHLAPELLLDRRPKITYETETYAMGLLFKDIGQVFEIDKLFELGEKCQATEPNQRPSTEVILAELYAMVQMKTDEC